jgi:hypothetical protein
MFKIQGKNWRLENNMILPVFANSCWLKTTKLEPAIDQQMKLSVELSLTIP